MKKFIKIISSIFVVFLIYILGLYFFQNKFLFVPHNYYISPTEASLPEFKEEPFTSFDGTEIMTWYYEGDKNKPAILYFHGNSKQIALFSPQLKDFIDRGYSVMSMEYRGFANTKGETRQNEIFQDCIKCYDFLKRKGYKNIVVYGYSFGTACASALTSFRDVDALVLMAPFYSMKRLVYEKPIPFASYIIKDEYPSYKYIKDYKNPLLILHGVKDVLIPFHNGEDLFNLSPSKNKEIVSLENDDHHSIFFDAKHNDIILKFIENTFK